MEEEDILVLGKGLVPDSYDPRDYILETQFGAAPPIEWKNTPLGRPEPPDWNQASSDSCVACGTTNVHWSIRHPNTKDWSRRDVFSRIALAYGAMLRDGVKQICVTGQQTQDECPDPAAPTMANMRVKSTKPDSAGMEDLEANYFVIKNNIIDAVAQGVRDYRAVLIGVNVSSAGWKDKTNPRPPRAGEDFTGHAIAAFDYHLHNGKKCIITKSSWCRNGHHIHHINEDYWTTGHTFNGWCVIPKEQQYMTNSVLCKRVVGNAPDGTPLLEFGFYDPATAEAALISDMRRRGINPPLLPDGKLDWPRVETLIGGAVIEVK